MAGGGGGMVSTEVTALFCRKISKAQLTSEEGPLDQNQDNDLNLPYL